MLDATIDESQHSAFGATVPALPRSARAFLLAAYENRDARDSICLTYPQLIELTGISMSSLQRAVKRLAQERLIVTLSTGRGQGMASRHQLTEAGLAVADRLNLNGQKPVINRTKPIQKLVKRCSLSRARVELDSPPVGGDKSPPPFGESAASLRSAAAAAREAPPPPQPPGGDFRDFVDDLRDRASGRGRLRLNSDWHAVDTLVAQLRAEGLPDETLRAAADNLGARRAPSGVTIFATKAREIQASIAAASAPAPGASHAQHYPGRSGTGNAVEYVERNGRRVAVGGFLAVAARIAREEAC